MVGLTGFEPAVSTPPVWRDNQASLQPGAALWIGDHHQPFPFDVAGPPRFAPTGLAIDVHGARVPRPYLQTHFKDTHLPHGIEPCPHERGRDALALVSGQNGDVEQLRVTLAAVCAGAA